MFKKLKTKRAQIQQLKKYKQYYKIVKAGQLFVEFIQNDVKDTQTNKMNRAQRRRMERELNRGGKLTPEIIQHYKAKIDGVLTYIEMQLNPPKMPKVKKVKQPASKGGVNEKPETKRPEAPKAQGK